MPTVTLPSGHTVELRDPADLKRRDRKALVTSIPDGLTPVQTGWAIRDAMLRVLITGWSFDAPLPPSEDFLDDLSLADEDALATAVEAARRVLFPDLAPKLTPSGQLEQGTPTSPSSR